MTVTRSPTGLPSPSSPKPKRKWPRALLAGFLSLLFPGTGQLLNRHPRKALLLAIPLYVLEVLLLKTRLLFTFQTMALAVVLAVAWRLFVIAEAAYCAAARKGPESSVPIPWFTYSLLALALSVPAIVLDSKKDLPIRAFKIPSASMCPTICVGERIVADMHSYQSHPPQRGDLILVQHPALAALMIKRVIALPGDTVGPGPDGGVIVSGRRFLPPHPCANAPAPIGQADPDACAAFKSSGVPEGTLFVVGDNLGNSFDSRIPEFAPVTTEMVRGKPVYIYWSPKLRRIGCPLR